MELGRKEVIQLQGQFGDDHLGFVPWCLCPSIHWAGKSKGYLSTRNEADKASLLQEVNPAWSRTLQGKKCRLLEQSADKHQVEGPSSNQVAGIQRVPMI